MGSAWWKFGDKPWPSSSWLRSASRLRHRSMPSYESPLRVAKERGKELRTRANLDAAADNSEMTCRCLNSEKAQRCVKAVPWTCWDPGGRGFLLCRLGFIPAAKTLIDRPGPLGFWAVRDARAARLWAAHLCSFRSPNLRASAGGAVCSDLEVAQNMEW